MTLPVLNPPAVESPFTWGVFPGDGGYHPVPAGASAIDMDSYLVRTPERTASLNLPQEVVEQSRSMVLVVDTLVYMQVSPGVGWLPIEGCRQEIPGRPGGRIDLWSDTPYNLLLLLGNGIQPPGARGVQLYQYRLADQTLTKSAASSTADSLAPLSFTASSPSRDGQKDLLLPQHGVDFIRCANFGQKVFLVRNLDSSNDVEVAVKGTGAKIRADNHGYLDDTDSGISATTVASDGTAVLETGLPFQVIQFQGRLPAATASGQTARVVVEYIGVAPALR